MSRKEDGKKETNKMPGFIRMVGWVSGGSHGMRQSTLTRQGQARRRAVD